MVDEGFHPREIVIAVIVVAAEAVELPGAPTIVVYFILAPFF